MMKIVLFIVASTVFAGSQASVIREAPESASQLDMLAEELKEYRNNANHFMGEIWTLVKSSKTSSAFLTATSNLTRSLNALEDDLPPEVKEAFDLAVGFPLGVLEKAMTALYDMQRRHDMVGPLKSAVSHYLDPILERANPFLRSLQQTLRAWIQELERNVQEKLPHELETLDAKTSYYLKKGEDIRESLRGPVDEAQTHFRQWVEALNKNLKPYMAPILEQSRKYKPEFKKWVVTSIFPLTLTLTHPLRRNEQRRALTK